VRRASSEVYDLYAALTEDENAGWVWINNPKYPSRSVVQIIYKKRKVFCQVRQIDANFLRRYEQQPRRHISDLSKAIVINEWYRDALGGLGFGPTADLWLKAPRWWWCGTKSVRAACHHPDLAVRLGTRLGVLGAWLGLVGVCLALPDQIKFWFALGIGLAAGIPALIVSKGTKPAERSRTADRGQQGVIAILGWGSLLWDWERSDNRYGRWCPDGPELKLEFSRISRSRNGALTLVIDPDNGALSPVAYCLFQGFPRNAMAHLRRREATTLLNIGYVSLNSASGRFQSSGRDTATIETIRHWAEAKRDEVKGLRAVIWTDLPSNFEQRQGHPFSIEAAADYLQTLEGAGAAEAMDYISRTPRFIKTPLKTFLEKQGWKMRPTKVG
jgi:hypothetical protein